MLPKCIYKSHKYQSTFIHILTYTDIVEAICVFSLIHIYKCENKITVFILIEYI